VNGGDNRWKSPSPWWSIGISVASLAIAVTAVMVSIRQGSATAEREEAQNARARVREHKRDARNIARDRPQVQVKLTTLASARVRQTSRPGMCVPEHFIKIAVSNPGTKPFVVTGLYLFRRSPDRNGVPTQLLGPGAGFGGDRLPSKVSAGEQVDFRYRAKGNRRQHRRDYLEVHTSIGGPAERAIPLGRHIAQKCEDLEAS
jgi:hypothetical protein